MHWRWWIGTLGSMVLACGESEKRPSAEAEKVVHSATDSLSEPSVEAFQGGGDSAEALLNQWYGRTQVDLEQTMTNMVLNTDQMARLFDCQTVDEQQQLDAKRAEFLQILETEAQRSESEPGETASSVQLIRARSMRTVELAAGEALDGCTLKRALRWHTVRSTVLSKDAAGQEVSAVHRCGMLEIDGRWFLKGVPGALMSETSREVAGPASKSPNIVPLRPIRLDHKHRVRRSGP